MTKVPTILLIDDDHDQHSLFQIALKEVGRDFTFYSAYTGEDALEKLNSIETLPDIIFLDLNMPLMDGKECLRALKMDDRLKDLPVIIYTTSTWQKDIEDSKALGADCYLEKPNDYSRLLEIITAAINNKYTTLSYAYFSKH